MRNNAAYLPESPIVYIILPKSIRNRASFAIFAVLYPLMYEVWHFAVTGNIWIKNRKNGIIS